MMKKRMFSFALIFAMVFTTVFAGAGNVFAAETSNVPSTPLNVAAMRTSAVAEPEYNSWTLAAGGYVLATITPDEKGLMYIDYAVSGGADAHDDAEFYMVESCQLTETGLSLQYNQALYWYGYPGDMDTYYKAIPVTAGTTYQMLIVADGENGADITVQARARVIRTGQQELAQGNGKWTIASGVNEAGEYGKATWFKIKPTTTGLMTINLKAYGCDTAYAYVQLYNAKKKAVSEKIWHSQTTNKAKFGVKKNTTYYIKVSGCYGSYGSNYAYGIKYTVTKYIDRAIAKKANARKLVRKADAVNALFPASASTSTDWYKFYVSSKRGTSITIDATDIRSGELTATFYKGSKKIGNPVKIYSGEKNPINITYSSTYGKADAGWYYVKVVKRAKASGRYSIKYVK